MGWGTYRDYISFDTAELSRGARRYRQYRDELDGIKKALQTAMDDLVSTYWIGKAATKFKNYIGDDWIDTVTRYCELMDDLTMIMDDVVKTYDNLLEQAKTVKVG